MRDESSVMQKMDRAKSGPGAPSFGGTKVDLSRQNRAPVGG